MTAKPWVLLVPEPPFTLTVRFKLVELLLNWETKMLPPRAVASEAAA